MPQIFHPSANTLARLTLFGLGVGPVGLLVLGYLLIRSPYQTNVRVIQEQPVPFSHEHHVARPGDRLPLLPHLGRDVGFAGHAADRHLHVCHSQIWTDSPMLEPVRASLRDESRSPGPGSTTFPTSSTSTTAIHVQKGVGCVAATAGSTRCR